MISADVNAYQVPRAGVAGNQWWLAPLRWHYIVGHPARQVMLGVLVVVLFVLALLLVAKRSWRYEAVRPTVPGAKTASRTSLGRPQRTRSSTEWPTREFWDGEGRGPPAQLAARRRGRRVSWRSCSVVTVRALRGGSPHASAWGWTGIALGAATIVLAAGYLVLGRARYACHVPAQWQARPGRLRRENFATWWCGC